jgi:flagellar FliL protein
LRRHLWLGATSASELHFLAAMSEESKNTAAPGTKGAKSSAVLIAGVAVVALGVGVGSTWFFSQRRASAQTDRPAEASGAPQYLVHLEGFTVNLDDPEETHFLRVTIDLGLDHVPPGSEREKASTLLPVPRIRDTILSVLTVCKAKVLLTPEGKSQLKKDLLEALKRDVPEVGIRDVYFTEFLVQR